jgi:hypothetical protein
LSALQGRHPSRRRWLHVALAALALVALDAAKPLVVDDAAYVYYARQILAHPGDPYGFEIHWNDDPEPAFEVLAPPVLPYWLAGSMALLGDEPPRWKLALLPFALALAAAWRSLCAGLAPGLATPLLWMALCSPSVLPFVNLMLDVPSQALALSGLALFLGACDRGSAGRAGAAGLLLGVALQTKYTAWTSLAALLLWGLLAGRARLALVAGAAAAGIFGGWEALMALRYGGSHLAHGFSIVWEARSGVSIAEAAVWALGFLTLLGAMAPAVGVLGVAAQRSPALLTVAAALAVAACFGAIPWLPAQPSPMPVMWPHVKGAAAEQWIFAGLGVATVASVCAAAFGMLRRGADRVDAFAVGWLAIEVAGFAALSPYLAARRVLGVALVGLLVCGRAASRSLGPEGAARAARVPLALGVALGMLFAAAEIADARAGREAVERAEREIAARERGRRSGEVWFVGHWSFQFYAERAGMRAVAAGRSQLRRGDWLVVPEGVIQQPIDAPGVSPARANFAVRSASPWSTNPWAYIGPTPMRARSDALIRVSLHRVVRDFVPERARERAPP